MTVPHAAVCAFHGTVWATVQPVKVYRGKYEQGKMHDQYQGKSSQAEMNTLLRQ